MGTFHLAGRQAALGLGLLAFLQGAPRLAAAAPPPAPNPSARPPVVIPPPATTLPEAANRQHLRYADREAESPRSADFRGGAGHHLGWYLGAGAVVIVFGIFALVVLL